MFYVALKFGFVEDVRMLNGKTQIDRTPHLRKAKPFTSFDDARSLMRKAGNNQEWAVLSTCEG